MFCSAVLTILGTTNSIANAASFSFDFESGLPSEALFLQTTSEGTEPFTPSIQTIDGNNVLLLSDDIPSSEGGAITSSVINPTITFENVLVSALLNPAENTNDRLLLFARIDLETADTYVFGIDFEANQLFLDVVVEGVVPETPLIEVFDVLPDTSLPYFAEFSVIGNELTGRIFDETGTDEIFELSFVDTNNTLSSGFTGIAADISDNFIEGDDPNNATIDNFSGISVPEPSSILGLLVFASLHRFSKRIVDLKKIIF